MMYSKRVDIWKIHSNDSTVSQSANGSNSGNEHSVLGKRKWEGDSDDDGSVSEPNEQRAFKRWFRIKSDDSSQNGLSKHPSEKIGKHFRKSPGTPPAFFLTMKVCPSVGEVSRAGRTSAYQSN